MNIPKPLAWIISLAPWIAAVMVVFWLLTLRFPPSGIAHFAFPVDGSSPWFDPFLPGDRVTSPGPQEGGWIGQRIIGEPVYASARVPGAFDSVDVSLEVKPLRQPLLEFGILQDPEAFQFNLIPVWSEELSQGWRPVSLDGKRGYVRSDQPDQALLTADPERMMVWYATTTSPERMDFAGTEATVNVSLRGGFDIYAVPTNGEISFKFALQDMNRTQGRQTVVIRLTRDDETVWTDLVSASGSHEVRPTGVFEKTVSVKNLPPGVYRLALVADDEVFFRRITTNARHWVIGPRLYLGDTVGYATSTQDVRVWTNSQHLVLQTFHKEGAQTVGLGTAAANVLAVHEIYPLDRKASERTGAAILHAPKGDLRVVGDGYFAFTPDALFYPKPRRMTDATKLTDEGIVAVLTPYEPPDLVGDGWIRFRTSWPVSSLNALKFELAAPGILVRQGAVDVRAASLTYRRPPVSQGEWWKYVRRELAAAWKRL